MYYADDGNNGEYGGYGGILKYSLINGTWTITGDGSGDGTGAIGALGDDVGRTPRVTGLIGKLQIVGNTTNVLLYATSFSNSVIYAVTDNTGFNGDPSGLTLTTLVGPTANESIRDIAFVPTNSAPSAPSNPFAAWQSQYFTTSQLMNPGDQRAECGLPGMRQFSIQFLAGFNPTNAAAYVHITALSRTNTTDARVDYWGASGNSGTTPPMASRTNVLEFTTGAVNGSYSSNSFASTGVTNILSGGIGPGH